MREFEDSDLRRWEAYASTGPFGFPDHARIVLHCVSDPDLRARYVVQEGDKADAEKTVARATADELRALLDVAETLK